MAGAKRQQEPTHFLPTQTAKTPFTRPPLPTPTLAQTVNMSSSPSKPLVPPPSHTRTNTVSMAFDALSPLSPPPTGVPRSRLDLRRSSSLSSLDVSPHYSLTSPPSSNSSHNKNNAGGSNNPPVRNAVSDLLRPDHRFSPRRHHRHPSRKR